MEQPYVNIQRIYSLISALNNVLRDADQCSDFFLCCVTLISALIDVLRDADQCSDCCVA